MGQSCFLADLRSYLLRRWRLRTTLGVVCVVIELQKLSCFGRWSNSLGQAAYEATTIIGNMAPTILVSALTGGAGAPAAVAAPLGDRSPDPGAAGEPRGPADRPLIWLRQGAAVPFGGQP